MKYVDLGNTGMKVSVFAQGCWAFGEATYWGHQEEADSIATVKTALDRGINFFDTAENYGSGYSEEVLGKALVGEREKAVIATKVGRKNLSREDLMKSCENSLKRLKTDYIDLYQIHWPNPDIPLEETMEAMEALKAQGKIRATGVCNFGKEDLSALLKNYSIETDQLPYSLLWRAIEYSIKPECVKNNIGIICYSPLAQGMLAGIYASAGEVPEERAQTWHFSSQRRKYAKHGGPGFEKETFETVDRIGSIAREVQIPMADLALSWVLHQEGVTSILVGGRKPQEVLDNIKAVDVKLSKDTLTALDEATRNLKGKLGKNGDMWSNRMR